MSVLSHLLSNYILNSTGILQLEYVQRKLKVNDAFFRDIRLIS